MTIIGKIFRLDGHRAGGLRIFAIMFICGGALVFGGGFGPLDAPGAMTGTQAIVRLESQWLNALSSADVKEIARILAGDFVRPAPAAGRFIDKATLLQYYRTHLRARSAAPRRMEKLHVDIYGSTAIARGVLVVPNSTAHNESRLLFTDVFVRRDGTWQAVSAQENVIGADG